MQKIEYVKSLEYLVKHLSSVEIVGFFLNGFKNPSAIYNYSQIKPYLFTSKSNFDNLHDENSLAIMKFMNGDSVYNQQNLSLLTNSLIQGNAAQIVGNPINLNLYTFHNTLISELNLARHFLSNSYSADGFEFNLQKGVILFEITVDGEGLETEKYIKIFTLLDQLIDTISKVVGEQNEKSELILLDSGSDTNVGVKAGIETVKSLFLVFKEIWDFIVNRKFYKQTQLNKALIESFDIRKKIKANVEQGIITQDEATEYNHLIKTRTEDLIGLQVLPKVIANESSIITNKELLIEYQDFKRLDG